MPQPPELPEQFRSFGNVFDVLADDRPMHWTIWDLADGHVEGAGDTPHERWQDAIDAVIAG